MIAQPGPGNPVRRPAAAAVAQPASQKRYAGIPPLRPPCRGRILALRPHRGRQYDGALACVRLSEGGKYRPAETFTEPDGVIRGYCEVLVLSIC